MLVDTVFSQYGILWVTSAGNSADSHWIGTTVDRNNDGFIDVPDSPIDDVIVIGHGGGPLTIAAVWDDWGSNPQLPAANQDIDIALFKINEGNQKPTLEGQSNNPQNGRGEPSEIIGITNASPGLYVLLMKAEQITQAVNIRVMLFQSRAKLCPTVATGSIGIPATARNALAVGAVDVQTGELSPYSSQGPTDDGRLKPEVSAPDNNLTLAYGNSPGQPGRFPGTSAACPHVSGFAALLKEMNPNSSVNELRQSVIQHVRVIGQAPNNQYGHGHIDASGVQIASGGAESTTEQSLSTEESLELLKPLLDLAE
jgi:subtilisin family serine protease